MMEYVVLGVLLIGMLLFLVGWLAVVIKGFQRHAIIGVFALLPVLNVVVLPSLWHRVSGWVAVSFSGLLLVLGAWLGGASTQLQQYLGTPPATVATTQDPPAPSVPPKVAEAAVTSTTTTALNLPPIQAQTPVPVDKPSVPVQSASPAAEPEAQTPDTEIPAVQIQALPANALYHKVFKALPMNKIGEHTGNYLQVVQKDGKRREGKLKNVTDTEITLEERQEGGVKSQVFRLNEIREVFVLRNQ